MAAYTLTGVFPAGTAVGVYLATNWRDAGLPPRGTPEDSQTTAATVNANGVVSFSGLADGTAYFAAAQIRGTWVYEGFTTPVDTSAPALDERLDAAEASLLAVESGQVVQDTSITANGVAAQLRDDTAWTRVIASGLASGTPGTAVLGTLNGDLYLFGSAAETTGALKGVWRYRNGAWLLLNALTTQDFNRLIVWGASEFNGKLYVGDRHGGKLYRLDLHASNLAADGAPAFTALTDLGTDFVGGEDVFPGPVWNGKLHLGTFGFVGEIPTRPAISPGVYSYDGTTVVQLLDMTNIGVSGEVTSLTLYDGHLWVTAVNSTQTLCEVWAIAPDGLTRLIYSGSTCYSLCNWNGELVGVVAHATTSKFVVFGPGGFVDLSPSIAVGTGGFASVMPVGDELWAFAYYRGIYRFGWDTARYEYFGATITTDGGVASFKVFDGYAYVAANQTVGLWRKKLGTGRVLRAQGRPQRSSGGSSPLSALIPSNPKTASYTLIRADAGKLIEMNSASATVLTIPLNATVGFPIGTVIEVARLGAGTVTVAATGGVTIRSRGSLLAIANQYGSASLRKRATDEWVLVGDLA